MPTRGGPITSGAPMMEGGAFDQRNPASGVPIASRPDVLLFETAPLDAPVTIAGNVTVRLFVSSDRLTTDFRAKLVDVYPPGTDDPEGFAMNLTDGILRAAYHAGFNDARPLPQGRVTALTIQLYTTANRFERGHRIRLEIASSNFPRFDVNPNDQPGADLSANRMIARNSVHMGGSTPSCMNLSVVPDQ